jgi:hypothetical protein
MDYMCFKEKIPIDENFIFQVPVMDCSCIGTIDDLYLLEFKDKGRTRIAVSKEYLNKWFIKTWF